MSEQPFLCIDIGGTKTAVSIMSEADGILAKQRFPTQGDLGPERGVGEMITAAQKLLADRGAPGGLNGDVKRIGVSVGAMFDPRTGCFGAAPHLPSWEGFPIVETLERALSLPVTADNDANACALAEWRFGAGQGCDHMAFLTFGTGLGAGLILNRQIYHGASALAGEIGATRVASDGPPVRGKPGCLEGFASGAGIAGLVRLRRPAFGGTTCLENDASAEHVALAGAAGDELALAILNESGDHLGRGLAILLDLLNLEVVVIGSVFSRCEGLLRPAMEDALKRDAMPATIAACRILPAALGEAIGDYAALAMAMATGGSSLPTSANAG
jgi:glucokinase